MDKQDRFWTPDRFTDVIEGIGKLQHRFLIEVFRDAGVSSSALVERLGLGSEVALAGVISGLSKQLKQLGVEPRQVFEIRVQWTGKKKTRYFILADYFGGAGIDLNWPEAWEETKAIDGIGSKTLVGDDSGVGN